MNNNQDISRQTARQADECEDGLNLTDYIFILTRQWRLIGFCVFVCAVIAIGYTSTRTKIYISSVMLSFEDQQQSLGYPEQYLYFGGKFPIEKEKIILGSRSLAEDVARKLNLNYVYTYQPADLPVKVDQIKIADDMIDVELQVNIADGGYRIQKSEKSTSAVAKFGEPIVDEKFEIQVSEREDPDDPEAPPRKRGKAIKGVLWVTRIPIESAAFGLMKTLSVREIGKEANVLEVSVRHPNPLLAQRLANTLTETYVQSQRELLSQEAIQTMEFLDEQIAEVSKKLEASEKEINDYKRQEGVFKIEDHASVVINNIARAEVGLSELQIKYNYLKSLKSGLATGGISRFLLSDISASRDEHIASSMVDQLATQLVELGQLQQNYTDEHPKVKTAMAGIAQTKLRITEMVDNSISALSQRIELMKKKLEEYELQMNNLPEAARQLASLTRTSQVNAELYIFLLKSYSEARIRRAQVVSNVRIIDPAILPQYPIYPRDFRNVMLGIILGLMIGSLLALGIHLQVDPISTSADVDRLLGLPVISIMPKVPHYRDALLLQPTKLTESQSPLAEAIRSLRTHVQFNSEGKSYTRILLCSPMSGEGKSTISANLAVAMATGGHKTILINADLRHPRQQQNFGLPKGLGLADILTDGTNLDAAIKEIQPDLYLMTAGSSTRFPTELLGSAKMYQLLEKDLKDLGFKYIIIDTPAGSLFTDPVIVASFADYVYIVARPDYTRKQMLLRLHNSIKRVGANIHGVIFNHVKTTTPSYGYLGFAESGKNYGIGPVEGGRLRSLLNEAIRWLIR